MNKLFLLLGILVFLPLGTAQGATDYYIKLDGVQGESTKAPARATSTTRVNVSTQVQVAATTSAPAANTTTGVEPDEIDVKATSDGSTKKGNVEVNWKVEEGQKLTTTPDFSILLGGGSDDDEAANEGREAAAKILLEGMQQEGSVPTESISLNFEKVKVKVKQELKLFGVLPVQADADVEIDAESKVTIKFPWWAFLASGKSEDVGQKVFDKLSQVLAGKHEVVKNAINNVK